MKKIIPFICVMGLFALVIVLWWLTPSFVTHWAGEGDYSKSGPFGDTFGAVTSLFSALTLIMVMFGLVLQRQELDELRAEVRAERERQRRKNFPLLNLKMVAPLNYEISPLEDEKYECVLSLENLGATAGDVKIAFASPVNHSFQIKEPLPMYDLPTDHNIRFCFTFLVKHQRPSFSLTVTFVTLEGDFGAVVFNYDAISDRFIRNNLGV